jgi:hypothetical protein
MILYKIKGFSKDTLIYGIEDGLGKMISVIILSRFLIFKDYGVIVTLTVSYAFLLGAITLFATVPAQLTAHCRLMNPNFRGNSCL